MLTLELRDFQLLRLHLTVAWKRVLRIICKLLHPIAQLCRMNAKVFRRLRIRNAALLDQPDSLKLELPCKLPSLHDAPPVP